MSIDCWSQKSIVCWVGNSYFGTKKGTLGYTLLQNSPRSEMAQDLAAVHVMRITSGSQWSLYALWWANIFHLMTAHFSMQWCIPIGNLRQVAISNKKTIKLTAFKGKQLKWRCHNDATILRSRVRNSKKILYEIVRL